MSKEKIRQAWMDRFTGNPKVDEFNSVFFNNEPKLKSAFKTGAYRPSVKLTKKIHQWLIDNGLDVKLSEIRPDVWGENDNGPQDN